MSTLMSTIWLDPRPKNFAHPHCSYKPPLRKPPTPTHPPNINARHKAACCAGFRILLWANLSRCSKAEGPLTPASRSAVSWQPVAMVTSALWQADAAAAAAASCMMRPPSLNTGNCVVVITSRSAPHHIALRSKLPPGFVEPARQKKERREKNDRSDFVYTCTCARTDRTNACVVRCKIPSN